MPQWDISTRASWESQSLDLPEIYKTGLLALERVLSRLYTFVILCVQQGCFSTRSWLSGLSGSRTL